MKPTTFLDAAALIHDVEYSFYADQTKADENMATNVALFSSTLSLAIKVAFYIKDLYGYEPKLLDYDEYIILRNRARQMLNSTPYKRMMFLDERKRRVRNA